MDKTNEVKCERRMCMSRGKSFDHKEKGHRGNFPKNSKVEEKDHSRTTEQLESIASYEAFKNRVKEDE
jgi:hypothetical protein